MGEERFDACIDLLYQSLADSSALQPAISSLRQALGATGATYMQVASSGEIPFFVGDGYDLGISSDFISYYAELDPSKPFVTASRPGVWFQDDRQFDPRHTAQPEYVCDFASKAGVRWFRCARLVDLPGLQAFFSVHRPADAKPFDASTVQALDHLLPHLARVSRLLAQTRQEQAASRVTQQALAALGYAVCAVTASGKLAFSNPAAEALFKSGSGVTAVHGSLRLPNPAEQDRLLAALGKAFGWPRTASVFLCPSGLQVRVVPVSDAAMAAPQVTGQPLALVYLAKAAIPPAAGELMQLFGFTAAEAQLALLLAQGATPDEMAAARGVKLPTIRTQLANIYRKTNTTTQAQALAAVMALPPDCR